MGSLRAQLLAWVIAPVACAIAINGWLTHAGAAERASERQDALLVGAARIIAEQLAVEEGSLRGDVPPAALELFQGDPADHVYYRATDTAGNVVFGTSELELPRSTPQSEQPLFFTSVVRAEPVRVVAYLQPVFGVEDAKAVLVEVAQTRLAHDSQARALWLHAVTQQLAMLLAVAALILFGLQRGLRPVLTLSDAVMNRKTDAGEPLGDRLVPREFAPLVAAINDYGRRLTQHTQAQRVFIQNAAHQLRTPFTLLQTQASFALRATDGAARQESLVAIRRTVHQSARLVNQLLALSAAEAGAGGDRPLEVVDLRRIVQKVLEDLAALAEARRIDLGLDQPAGPVFARGRGVGLREIFMNLVDNAVRYTPPGGVVTACIARDGDQASVTIEDNGPGIPPSQRAMVFERFHRLDNSDSDGCGLGLAVVRELAADMGAAVELATPPGGRGLAAIVRLPLEPGPPGEG
ncbi:MAG: sensor histidine kinase, partial [Burkholderiaceae bacterium]